MKKLLFILLPALLLSLAACNTAEKAQTASNDVKKETMEKEPEMTDGDKSFMVKTLNDTIASPRMELTGKVGGADVTVNFGSPKVKGRTIWGELVKYDKVWRTGANEATTIELAQDVTVNGEALAAGTYALFTVPAAEGAWKVVFNSEADQWGAYNKDASKDVLTVEATPSMGEDTAEGLTFAVNGDQLVVMWDKLSLPITIKAAG